MLNYIVDQVGIIKTICLFAGTILMIGGAQYLSFRETCAQNSFEWKQKPVRSFLRLVVKQELNYTRKIPAMIGAIFLATTLAVYL
jgi:hypothetical protein